MMARWPRCVSSNDLEITTQILYARMMDIEQSTLLS